jgi:hypothetical protein
MTDVLRALAVLVVLFLTGAPIILCVRARRREWTAAVFEAIALGLLVQVAIGITALRTAHYSRVGLGVMTLTVIVVASIIAIRQRTHITWPRLDVPWLLITLGLVAVALFLRKYPVYFLWESGDMGEYVNRANRIAEGANLLQSFPHGFTVFLASTHTLLGPSGTFAPRPRSSSASSWWCIRFRCGFRSFRCRSRSTPRSSSPACISSSAPATRR